jgi:hypothetical protein
MDSSIDKYRDLSVDTTFFSGGLGFPNAVLFT